MGTDDVIPVPAASPSDTDLSATLEKLLGELVDQYTGGGSRSVQRETATRLLHSIAYSVKVGIDAWSRPAGGSGQEIAILKVHGLRAVYEQGRRTLKRRFRATRRLYARMVAERLHVPLSAYTETLDIELPLFFQRYDIAYGAHEIPCAIDYPLALDVARGQGLHYIETWLDALRTETDFCRRFGEPALVNFLARYETRYRLDISGVPFNLFAAVFEQALYAMLCGQDPLLLVIPDKRFAENCGRWRRLSAQDMEREFRQTAAALAERLGITASGLKAYMTRYAISMLPRFRRTLADGNQQNLALIGEENAPVPTSDRATVQDGESMEAGAFLFLLEELGDQETADGKIRLVLERVHSGRDLVDVLESGMLDQAEESQLFAGFGDTELAVVGQVFLNKAGLPEAFYGGDAETVAEDLASLAEEASEDWHRAWLDRLGAMAPEAAQAVLRAAREIDAEDDR